MELCMTFWEMWFRVFQNVERTHHTFKAQCNGWGHRFNLREISPAYENRRLWFQLFCCIYCQWCKILELALNGASLVWLSNKRTRKYCFWDICLILVPGGFSGLGLDWQCPQGLVSMFITFPRGSGLTLT